MGEHSAVLEPLIQTTSALGMSVQYHLLDAEQGAGEPGVVVHR